MNIFNSNINRMRSRDFLTYSVNYKNDHLIKHEEDAAADDVEKLEVIN